MLKKLFQFLTVLIVGIIGGALWQAYFFPLLAQNPRFANFEFVKILTEREVNVFPKEEVIIRENTALVRLVEKVESSVVGVSAQTKSGKTLEGSGVILTSDGLIVTLNELLPRGSVFSFWVEGELVSFEIFKRDEEQNLALVKLKGEGFNTISFIDPKEIKKGERIFAVWIEFSRSQPERMTSEGIIQFRDEEFFLTSLVGGLALRGSPLFNIEGNLLGINRVDSQGKVNTIPISSIRAFAGL